MRRGEVWSVSGGPDYAGKPRPAVIVQDDAFNPGDSVTLCPLTTDSKGGPLARVSVEATASNGLRQNSRLMVDKIITVPIAKLGARIGVLSDTDMDALDQAMLVFLGLASAGRRRASG